VFHEILDDFFFVGKVFLNVDGVKKGFDTGGELVVGLFLFGHCGDMIVFGFLL
jgi:hypothetical protein